MDKRILSALNTPQAFAGKITNNANIGKSSGELVAMWNEAYPEDPVVTE